MLLAGDKFKREKLLDNDFYIPYNNALKDYF